MRESKECLECGGIYFRPEGYTGAMWEARRYCGQVCAGKGASRRHRAKKAEAETGSSLVEEAGVEETAPFSEPEKQPVIRELRIVRVGPNPRMLVCEYMELAERRVCAVFVKRNSKFVRGMRFKMAEPVKEADFVRPWVYAGAPPRRRGKW